MKLLTKAVRGTQDILPSDSYKFRFVQDIMLNEAKLYGFKEIRTPIFEHTELFDRGVGGDTDVVQKEMYTFNDKGGRSLTLKPEGTVSAARAMLEHGIFNDALPLKMTYITPCYRYEKPQSGRYREFYQFGVEMFGAASPAADAEIICLATTLFERLGISNLSLEINSIGCPKCRKNYQTALKNYFSAYKNDLCATCVERLERNPMRIVDCKNSDCQKISQNAPNIIDFLCEDCQKHFDDVKIYLDNSNIEYKINPKIVRGLDYYTKTVFEFVAENDAQRGLVCGGGGRYDGLVEEIGGISMPAVGFGIGVERLLLLMESQEIEIPQPKKCDIFIATADENAYFMALCLAKTLREASFYAEFDVVGRGLKAQLKYAGKINAKFCLVLGESELSLGKAEVKNMSTGEKYSVRLDGNFLHDFVAAEASCELKGLNLLND
ncbi:histidine--tRNA ligase [Clostridium sp. CAG:557]|nr:histidine--tRNA ligase [Clostridium sp. CAG:557]